MVELKIKHETIIKRNCFIISWGVVLGACSCKFKLPRRDNVHLEHTTYQLCRQMLVKLGDDPTNNIDLEHGNSKQKCSRYL